jgi:hypothetical protein
MCIFVCMLIDQSQAEMAAEIHGMLDKQHNLEDEEDQPKPSKRRRRNRSGKTGKSEMTEATGTWATSNMCVWFREILVRYEECPTQEVDEFIS